MRRDWLVVAVLGLTLAQPALAQKGVEVPVMVGGYADLDACGSIGAVTGLDPAGDNFLAVRAGPGTGYAQLDSLHTGDEVHLCDQQGSWIGILYRDGGGPAGDCGVSTPIANATPYAGDCRGGWVFETYIAVIAG